MSRNTILTFPMTLMMMNGALGAPMVLPTIKQDLIRKYGPCELYQPVTTEKFENLPGEASESFTRTCFKCPKEVALEFVEEFTQVHTKRARQSVYVNHDNNLISNAVTISEAFILKHSCKKIKTEKTNLYTVDNYSCVGFTVKRSQGEEKGVKMFTMEVTLIPSATPK